VRDCPPPEPEALDLGTAVLPVVLKSYATQIAAGLVGLLVVLAVVLRRRRRR
jgi:LPXTG-motif cell wall-anchored protein